MKRRCITAGAVVIVMLSSMLIPLHRTDAASEYATYAGLTGSYQTYGGGHYVSWSPWGVAYLMESGATAQLRIYQCSDPSNASPFQPFTSVGTWVYLRPNNYNPTPLTFCTWARKAAGSGSSVTGTLDWDGP